MKPNLFIATFLLVSFALQAQVTLDKKYNFSTAVVSFETLGYKYFLMDVPNAQCRIYNADHSLFKTINCNVPSGYFLYDIKFLSEKLFDSDSGIELLCTFSKYYSTQNYYEYNSKIIRSEEHTLWRVRFTTTSTKPAKMSTNFFRTVMIFRFFPKRYGPTFTASPDHRQSVLWDIQILLNFF
jgi:hypothetical protein